ncbi:5'-AMP-activated protein kinase catalytic subunit alpha-2-like [Sycon ciliatum]|uniref:5'-AMP-activated protein kinase catalytic subunit alpha-2-like n=1 Tax=Sycon ciliatum TaxID=27933 RepID=UPI0020AA26E3|eukprot:scpid17967/ scgid31659/ 5&apos
MSQLKIGQYVLGTTLGKGSFGKVKLGKHQLTGHEVAVKIINRKKMRSVDASGKVRREIQYLKLFNHPHIIKLYQVIPTPADIFMVMEYVSGGELFDYIIKHGKLEESEARRFFQQIISGVDYCHRHFIVHRDLKPENLLVDGHGNVKIADFGLSNMMMDGEFLHTSCGSPNYAAPEVISAKLYAGPEVDIWSCGVILYALLNGTLPFDDENMGMLFKKIRSGQFTIPVDMPPESADLVKKMLVVDSLNRATMQDVKSHEWFLVGLPDYLFPSVFANESTSVQDDVVEEIASRFKVDRQAVLNALQGQNDNDDLQLRIAYQLVVDNRQVHVTRETPPALSSSLQTTAGAWGLLATSPLRALPNVSNIPSGQGPQFFQPSHYAHMDTGKKPRWHLGIRCSSQCAPSSIMREIYQSLLRLGFEWKTVSAFTVICRKFNSIRNRYAKMTLQLYKVDNAYLVDFKSVTSVPAPSHSNSSAAAEGAQGTAALASLPSVVSARISTPPLGVRTSPSALSEPLAVSGATATRRRSASAVSSGSVGNTSTAAVPASPVVCGLHSASLQAMRPAQRLSQSAAEEQNNSMEFFEMCALLVSALVVR